MTSRWWPRRRRRGAEPEIPVGWPDAWLPVLARHVPGWRTLAPQERTDLVEAAGALLGHFRWEAARGFAVDDTMKVVIAANAALPVLTLGVGCYEQVSSIIVHPGTITLTGERSGPLPGTVTDSPHAIDGEAHHRGPILLSWSAVRDDTRHPARGLNVVMHEFAHRLDMLDGLTDGTPPLGDETRTRRWVEVCTREFEALQVGEPDPVLRDYAAENAGEFFAVCTEVFFCRPVALRDAKADLYDVLRDFYGQDPAARADAVAWRPTEGDR